MKNMSDNAITTATIGLPVKKETALFKISDKSIATISI